MTCREFIEEFLPEYLEGSLDPGLVRDLERHLEACKPCVAFLNTYRRVAGLARGAEPAEMPAEMRAVLVRVLGERFRPGR